MIDNGIVFFSNKFNQHYISQGIVGVRLSKESWVESLNIISYLINGYTSIIIWFITHGEVDQTYFKIQNLKAFGCAAYAHIKYNNLRDRKLKCVFNGYLDGVKGTKLWCVGKGNKMMILSRDVVFHGSNFLLLIRKEINCESIRKVQMLEHYVVKVGSQIVEHKEEVENEV